MRACDRRSRLTSSWNLSAFNRLARTTTIPVTGNRPNVQPQAPIPMVKITGTVRDPEGAPAAGVRLSLTGDYGRYEVQTDSDGRYLFNKRKRDSANAPHGYIVARDEVRNLWDGHNIRRKQPPTWI